MDGACTPAATARRIRNEIFLSDDNGQQVYLLHVQMPQLYKYLSPRMDDDMHRDVFQANKEDIAQHFRGKTHRTTCVVATRQEHNRHGIIQEYSSL